MSLEGTKLGHYRLTRFLQRGGMGEVYLAEDLALPREVAIKVMKSEALYPNLQTTQEATRLFRREMRAIAMLDHPHILTLYEAGEQKINREQVAYMVMPYCPAGSLADWIQQYHSESLLSPQEVSQLLAQAAEALQHAHDQSILHLDIKPQNFLVRRELDPTTLPNLLLADFGVAKISNSTKMSGTARGTSLYMAPEQLANQPVPASDQYALAIMVYELLVGRTPFEDAMPLAIAYQHAYVAPDPPSQVKSYLPNVLDAVILRALAKKPEERFASVRDFAQAYTVALSQWQYQPMAQPASASSQALSSPLYDSDEIRWAWDPIPSLALERTSDFEESTKKEGRRSVIALLVAGGLVAVGTPAVVLNLNDLQHLLGLTNQTPVTQKKANNAPANAQSTPPPPTPQMKTGTSIGSTNQAANSAVTFTNPANGTPGLLVRLANGTFVAYDRACTHLSVLVSYDPMTKMLVCPAHGAVFDPAKGGAVVKGPAQLPLTMIGIQVQADGTVTTVYTTAALPNPNS